MTCVSARRDVASFARGAIQTDRWGFPVMFSSPVSASAREQTSVTLLTFRCCWTSAVRRCRQTCQRECPRTGMGPSAHSPSSCIASMPLLGVSFSQPSSCRFSWVRLCGGSFAARTNRALTLSIAPDVPLQVGVDDLRWALSKADVGGPEAGPAVCGTSLRPSCTPRLASSFHPADNPFLTRRVVSTYRI
jgi:hypothetical protein